MHYLAGAGRASCTASGGNDTERVTLLINGADDIIAAGNEKVARE